MRRWYEVRIKERHGEVDLKKSRFYFVNSMEDARKKYRGVGSILTVTKASPEQILGVGEFFRLGNILLEDLADNKVPKESSMPPTIIREAKNGLRY